MIERTWTVYSNQLRANEVKRLSPIIELDGEEVILHRHITRDGRRGKVLDEYVVYAKRLRADKIRLTIGVAEKKFTPRALELIKPCENLTIVTFEEEIPYVLYRGVGTNTVFAGAQERLQYIEREERPKVAWVELVDPDGVPIPGTSWQPHELPNARLNRRHQ